MTSGGKVGPAWRPSGSVSIAAHRDPQASEEGYVEGYRKTVMWAAPRDVTGHTTRPGSLALVMGDLLR